MFERALNMPLNNTSNFEEMDPDIGCLLKTHVNFVSSNAIIVKK